MIKKYSILGIILFMLACSSQTTKITGSWKEYQDKTYDFNKIAVLGVFPKADTRIVLEDKLETLMEEQGFNADGGLGFLPPTATEGSLGIDIVKAFLDSEKVDAVMLVSIFQINDQKTYYSGAYTYYPWNDASFGDYYGQMQNVLYTPGYYTVSTNVFLEVNLYTYPDEELIWSAQTKTVNMTDLDRGAESVSKAIVKGLLTDKVLQPNQK